MSRSRMAANKSGRSRNAAADRARRTAGRATPANDRPRRAPSAASGFSGPSIRYRSSSVKSQRSRAAARESSGGQSWSISSRTASPLRRLCSSFSTALSRLAALLLVDVKLAVARDAERPVAENCRAGKQIGQVMADQLAQINVILPRRPSRGSLTRRGRTRGICTTARCVSISRPAASPAAR